MQIPMWLVHALKSGEFSLFTDETKTLQLKVENKKIDVNIMNKELLKDILRVGVEAKGKSLLGRLTELKNVAEELKRDGLTITISHKGCIVLTLGSGANPTLSQSVTRTNAIEINNLSKLIRLII
ncbi:MAG: hypothetical protein ACE5OW_01025 [Candidatus Bathyarchaeia archaeon]